MKTKTLVALTLMTTLACGSFTGCVTNKTPTTVGEKAQRMAMVAELASFTGATVWLSGHPEDRDKFVTALNAVELLLLAENGTPAQLAEALKGLPIDELKSKEGTLIIGAAAILYDAYLREYVNMDTTVYLKPVIAGIHSGLSRALASELQQ